MLALLAALVSPVWSADLPEGSAPPPVAAPHFPDALHAFVWRNWQCVPTARLAQVVGAEPADIRRMGRAMGLAGPPAVTERDTRRLTTTIIRRNWHLLPYDQLLQLLGWTPEQMAYHLREDDFLFTKLGSLKPRCESIRYAPPDAAALQREREIAALVGEAFPAGVGDPPDPPLGFVQRLSRMPVGHVRATPGDYAFSPRFCFSYFGLTGDPLLDSPDAGYPDGLLARLAECGVDGVWLQAVLYKLAPFPWEPALSADCQKRLVALRNLVARARRFGIGIHLYLNEPRAMPLTFFENHPELKGVTEGSHATLCTSVPEVQNYVRDAVAHVCQAVPDLQGFFSITASENLTNCWSHHRGADCPRCGTRKPEEVIAEVNGLFREGIAQAGTNAELIAWDWGWQDSWAPGIITRLPNDVALMSVSEWSMPIERGGIPSVIGEYALSVVGPGPRATRHWGFARERGLKIMAKIQAGCTWELSAVPYIPVVANVAQHAANLRDAGVDGLMLGWTLGGCPSPNLEVVAEVGKGADVQAATLAVARRRFGDGAAPAVVEAWREFSEAFSEYPYHGGGLYSGPQQLGPANPLWERPTGYSATMVGFPYDHLDAWRAVYPAEVYATQFELVADGFDRAVHELRRAARTAEASSDQAAALAEEAAVGEVCAIHFRSVANQARFVLARQALASADSPAAARPHLATLGRVLEAEIGLACRLHALQSDDSRFGYEASNQYYYLSVDLAEKVLNCRDLLDRWLPEERKRLGLQAPYSLTRTVFVALAPRPDSAHAMSVTSYSPGVA